MKGMTTTALQGGSRREEKLHCRGKQGFCTRDGSATKKEVATAGGVEHIWRGKIETEPQNARKDNNMTGIKLGRGIGCCKNAENYKKTQSVSGEKGREWIKQRIGSAGAGRSLSGLNRKHGDSC